MVKNKFYTSIAARQGAFCAPLKITNGGLGRLKYFLDRRFVLSLSGRQIINDRPTRKDASLSFRHTFRQHRIT